MTWSSTDELRIKGLIFPVLVVRVGGEYTGKVLDLPDVTAKARTYRHCIERLQEELLREWA